MLHGTFAYKGGTIMASTEQTLRNVLNKIAEELQLTNHEIIIKDLSSGGGNFTSKIFTATIKQPNKDDLQLFAKVAAIGEKFRKEIKYPLFETERFAYTKLQEIFRSLEEQNGVPKEHRFMFTKCYKCEPTPFQETVVLENLLAQGYSAYDRFEPFSWEYASSAVTEIAKLHALSYAYSDQYPEEFKTLLAKITVTGMDEIITSLKSSEDSAVKTIRPEYKQPLRNFLEQSKNDMQKFYTTSKRPTITHGDFRGSNLMHKVRQDGTVEIKILDLQTLQGGSPVTDLLYFIFTGSDEQFRAKYFQKLIDHYYTQFSECMTRLNLNVEEFYPREDFDAEMKEKLPFGLTLAVFALPMMTVAAEKAPKVDEHMELDSFSVENTSDLYVERLNGVVNDYIKWGILKIE